MDSIDALDQIEEVGVSANLDEKTDQARLLFQIANGLIAAHARIDVLEDRLITSTMGAVKKGCDDFSIESRDHFLQLQAAVDSHVTEIRKTVEIWTGLSTEQIIESINLSEKSTRLQLTDVEESLVHVTEVAQSMSEQKISTLSASVTKGIERLDQRLDKAEKELLLTTRRTEAISLRWRILFLLLGLVLVSLHAYQVYSLHQLGSR